MRDFISVSIYQLRQLQAPLDAIGRRQVSPGGKCSLSCDVRRLDIIGICLMDIGDLFLRRRVDDRERLARFPGTNFPSMNRCVGTDEEAIISTLAQVSITVIRRFDIALSEVLTWFDSKHWFLAFTRFPEAQHYLFE